MAEGSVEGIPPSAPDEPAPERTVEVVGRELAEKFGCDIFLYNGPISEEMYGKVVSQILRRKRKELLVILVTLGGEANAAYRIARLFQQLSTKFTILVPSYCKSAGTIVALGAHELWMSVFSELGPLDVQLAKYDEIGERRSGLTTHSALESIKEQAFEMFGDTMMEIKRRSRFRVRFRTAADLATNLTAGLFSKIYEQLDPVAMGEDYRDLHVALEYGERLARHSQNLKPGAVSELVHNYPSHDFVIDDDEAKKLFRSVKSPPKEFFELLQLLGADGMKPLTEEDGIFKFLSPELEQGSAETVPSPSAEAHGDQDDVAVQPSAEAATAV
jgi:hypothetical protein